MSNYKLSTFYFTEEMKLSDCNTYDIEAFITHDYELHNNEWFYDIDVIKIMKGGEDLRTVENTIEVEQKIIKLLNERDIK